MLKNIFIQFFLSNVSIIYVPWNVFMGKFIVNFYQETIV